MHDRGGLALPSHAVHEAAVDLQRIEREGADVVQAGVAGTEIVDRDAEPHLPQPVEGVGGTFGVFGKRRLGDLDLQLVRGNAGPLDLRHQLRNEVLPAELARGEVHRNELSGPALRRLQRLFHDPVAEVVDQAALLGHRDEHTRRNHAMFGATPAEQRLERDHFQSAARKDRLVDERQFAVSHRLAEPGLDLAAEADRLVHALIEHPDQVPPCALRLVQRQVCTAHDVDRVALMIRVGHHEADRGGVLHRLAKDAERARAGAQQPLAAHHRLVLTGHGHHQPEFVTGQPGNQALLADLLGEEVADGADHFIAGEMAEGVVDRLEPVDVEHRHGEATRHMHAFAERAQEGEPVGRFGQGIVAGDMGRLALVRGEFPCLFLELRDLFRQGRAGSRELAVQLPAVRKRGCGLHHLDRLERLGDVEDLVRRAGGAENLGRREVREAGDDHQVHVRIDGADSLRSFLAVDAGRHADVDERHGERRADANGLFDRSDCLQPLGNMHEFEFRSRRHRRSPGVTFLEELGRHGGQGALPLRPAERMPVGFVHRRFVVYNQYPHRGPTPSPNGRKLNGRRVTAR